MTQAKQKKERERENECKRPSRSKPQIPRLRPVSYLNILFPFSILPVFFWLSKLFTNITQPASQEPGPISMMNKCHCPWPPNLKCTYHTALTLRPALFVGHAARRPARSPWPNYSQLFLPLHRHTAASMTPLAPVSNNACCYHGMLIG